MTNPTIEVGWFIATLVGLHYSTKTWGAVKTLWAIFGTSSVVGLVVLFSVVGTTYRTALTHPIILIVPGVLAIEVAVYAVSWWTLWKRQPSARAWAVGASLLYILPSLFTIIWSIHRSRSIRSCTGIMFGIGVVGLLVLLRRGELYDPHRNWRQLAQ